MDRADPFTSRSRAERFMCPRCGAAPGSRCIGARDKVRESCHRDRHERALTLLDLTGSWAVAEEVESDRFFASR